MIVGREGVDWVAAWGLRAAVLEAAVGCLVVWVLPPDAQRGRFDRLLVFSEGRLARDESAAAPAA